MDNAEVLHARIEAAKTIVLSEISDLHLALGNVEINKEFPESEKALKITLKNRMRLYSVLCGKSE